MKIQDTIIQYFGQDNYKIIRDKPVLYRCLKRDAVGKVYQLVYIDDSDAWIEDNLQQYLDDILRDDYYESEDYLQWNVYYFFITPDDIIKKYQSRKTIVEKDEIYARKYVLGEKDYCQLLADTESITRTSVDGITSDLYTRWVNFLRENKLHFVYNEKSYPNFKSAVEEYVNSGPFDEIEDSDIPLTQQVGPSALDRITNLQLTTFRKFPLQRTFDLAQVNLLHGPNATGKTSFFDALELIITGASKDNNTTDFNLKFIDSYGGEFSFPVNSSVCKQRDIAWYKSAFNKGHNLNGNFNKFNYYASDAAFLLKQDDDSNKNNIEEVIAHIALGREVNRLEERINGFKSRFEDQLGGLRYEENRMNSELTEKNDQIRHIASDRKDPEIYKSPLMKLLHEMEWKYSDEDQQDKFLVSLETSLQTTMNTLENIRSKAQIVGKFTWEEIKNDINQLEEEVNEQKRLRESILRKQRGCQEKEKGKTSITSTILLIKNLQRYYKYEDINALIGFKDRIENKRREQERLKTIRDEAESLQRMPFLERTAIKEKSIRQNEVDIQGILKALSNDKSSTRSRIDELEIGINRLAAIIADIQSQGISYANLNPDATNCPLCNTQFEKGRLLQEITKSKNTFDNSGILRDLKIIEQEQALQLTETERNLNCILSAKKVAMLLNATSWENLTITTLFDQIKVNNDTLSQITEELVQLNILQAKFASDKMEEEEFDALKQNVATRVNREISKDEDYDNLLKEQEDKLQSLDDEINKLQSEIDQEKKSVSLSADSTASNEDSLNRRLANLKELNYQFSQIELYMKLAVDVDVLEISEKIERLKSSFELYKKAYQEAQDQTETLRYIEEENKNIINKLSEVTRKKRNAETAFNLLAQLMKEQNKEQFLQDYLNINKNEILEIFRSIHFPREFKDIVFENNKVGLVDSVGDKRTLNEISTGQRSALALSLFLSLNKNLPNGPNMVLMDDPVTYVDDLNLLSFLDYLRELTIQTGRQIFFATANADLAFLFRKKFEFLGNDRFKEFTLSRES